MSWNALRKHNDRITPRATLNCVSYGETLSVNKICGVHQPLRVKIPLALIWNVSVFPVVTDTSAGVLSNREYQIKGLVTVPVGAEMVFET